MPASLSGRLILGSVVITLVAGILTLWGVGVLLDRFVTGQIDQRLDNKIVTLASQVRVSPDGTIRLEGDADGPPFDKPHHQSFWWVGGPKNAIQTRWLPIGAFTPPSAEAVERAPAPPPLPHQPDIDIDGPPVANARTLVVEGPQGVPIHLRASRRDIGGRSITILAAAPMKAIRGPLREALSTLGAAVLGLGLVLLGVAFWLVRLGLAPLGRLQTEIAEVRAGRRINLSQTQPVELRPLVNELNVLLAQNAENLTRARRHVANLAHGLKTPLATLSLTVDRLDGGDRVSMQGLVGAIERRVRHHLGRARAAALDGPARAQTRLRPRLVDLVDTLAKIHADRRIDATIACGDDAVVACEPQDVDEMLGNLLENAFKYAAHAVACHVREAGPTLAISITDDGPGLTTDEIARVLRPGQRLDEATPGHGFGLPIARELAELYGGTLELGSSDSGLMVTLTLPRVR